MWNSSHHVLRLRQAETISLSTWWPHLLPSRHRFNLLLSGKCPNKTLTLVRYHYTKLYKNMGTTRKWFRTIRRKLVGSSNRDIVVVYTNTTPSTHDESAPRYKKFDGIASSSSSFIDSSPSAFERRIFTEEDIAAIRLQAFFRGHLVHYPNLFLFFFFIRQVLLWWMIIVMI